MDARFHAPMRSASVGTGSFFVTDGPMLKREWSSVSKNAHSVTLAATPPHSAAAEIRTRASRRPVHCVSSLFG